LPDIVTTEEAKQLFMATFTLSYRVFYFTIYSLGLRLGEGLRLEVGDIDASRKRIHIRNAKGNKDRLVPLPDVTLQMLRRFWQIDSAFTSKGFGGYAGLPYFEQSFDAGTMY